MGEEDLPGVEAARVVALLLGPCAEEGELEAERTIQPARHVPPLGAEFRMRAMVAREFERTRTHHREPDLFSPGGCRQEHEAEEGSAPHASIMLFAWPM